MPFEIPESWAWCCIPEVCFFQEGPGILAKDFCLSGIPLIRIAGMKGEKVSLSGCNYLDPILVEKKWNHFRIENGDIVISTSATLDKIAVVDEETSGAVLYTGLIRFKVLKPTLKKYFIYFLMSPFYFSQIAKQESGSTIKHYGPSHLKKMFLPLPPLSEQKRIVVKIEKLLHAEENLHRVV